MKRRWHILAIVFAILFTIAIPFVFNLVISALGLVWIPSDTGPSWSGHWGPREYYDGESIPDGWYWIQSGWNIKNGTITFPYCSSSGTRLHGTWNTTVYLPDNYQGNVRVQGQVIVEKNP